MNNLKLQNCFIAVHDHDEALAFYRDLLGLEVRSDVKYEGMRWTSVGPKDQPDHNILLAKPAPPMFSDEDARVLSALIAKGAMAGGVIETDDCKRTYEELKQRGVTFVQEPAERPYGIEALLRDDSGNWFSLTQRRNA